MASNSAGNNQGQQGIDMERCPTRVFVGVCCCGHCYTADVRDMLVGCEICMYADVPSREYVQTVFSTEALASRLFPSVQKA